MYNPYDCEENVRNGYMTKKNGWVAFGLFLFFGPLAGFYYGFKQGMASLGMVFGTFVCAGLSLANPLFGFGSLAFSIWFFVSLGDWSQDKRLVYTLTYSGEKAKAEYDAMEKAGTLPERPTKPLEEQRVAEIKPSEDLEQLKKKAGAFLMNISNKLTQPEANSQVSPDVLPVQASALEPQIQSIKSKHESFAASCYCSQCGGKVTESARFCHGCGSKVENAA
jgi:hypothetical protein